MNNTQLRSFLVKYNLSIAEFSKLAGIDEKLTTMWADGVYAPNEETLKAVKRSFPNIDAAPKQVNEITRKAATPNTRKLSDKAVHKMAKRKRDKELLDRVTSVIDKLKISKGTAGKELGFSSNQYFVWRKEGGITEGEVHDRIANHLPQLERKAQRVESLAHARKVKSEMAVHH